MACAQVNELYIAAGKNALYAQQGRASANDFADRVGALFKADADLMDYFNHTLADGKWNHFMDQVHIGYTNWEDPPRMSCLGLAGSNCRNQRRWASPWMARFLPGPEAPE